MSTRGSVAWLDKKGKWEGVYNHFDSYPSGLGDEVLAAIKKYGVAGLIEELHPFDDWRQLGSTGVCEYCGKRRGQPHSISGVASVHHHTKMLTDARPLTAEEKEALAVFKKTGFPDPQAKHHKHNKMGKKFDPREDPLFMEYVYLIRPDKNAVEVWSHCHAATLPDDVEFTRPVPLGYGNKECYVHYKVGEFKPSFKTIGAIDRADGKLSRDSGKKYDKLDEEKKKTEERLAKRT